MVKRSDSTELPVMVTTITYRVFYHGYQCFTTTLILLVTLYEPKPFFDHLQIDDLRDYQYLEH